MKIVTGSTNGFQEPIIGQITKKKMVSPFSSKSIYIFEHDEKTFVLGHKGYIYCSDNSNVLKTKKPAVLIDSKNYTYFHEGDVVRILPSGEIMKVWDVNSKQNALFITDRCDSKCIMCPQPPRSIDSYNYHKENLEILRLVSDQSPEVICLTGGEPFLNIDQCKDILSFCRQEMPETEIMILTNARRLENFEKTKKLVEAGNLNVLYCVSLHGDVNSIHDSIVRIPGAFDEAIRGIHNLARFRQKIEIRFVISRMNYDRLPSMSEFVYRNFPYATHVAFMGLEYTGEAGINWEKIIIDPSSYSDELTAAVRRLYRRGMNVSVYNIPLCLLNEKIWDFARDSISTWKKSYLPQCEQCALKNYCCGVFTTSKIQSENITPVVAGEIE